MDTLLSVLLYLNVVSSPATYYTTQIDSIAKVYSMPISNVKNNLTMLNMVLMDYESGVANIIIIDNGELK